MTQFEKEVRETLNNLMEDLRVYREVARDKEEKIRDREDQLVYFGRAEAFQDAINLVDQTLHGVGLIGAIHSASDRSGK